jgi:hypothetical protein
MRSALRDELRGLLGPRRPSRTTRARRHPS